MMNAKELEAEYKKILGDTHFWNCVDIENARGNYLWSSVNPSGGEDRKIPFNLHWVGTDNYSLDPQSKYWNKLKGKIGRHINQFGHIDLLPILCSDEAVFLKKYRGKEESPEFKRFVALLKITQEFIEDLRPKLIVYSNASTSYLWRWPKQTWMGYILEPVHLSCPISSGRIFQRPDESLFKIVGINTDDHVIKDVKTTSLRGTYLLFDNQNDNHFGHPEISAADFDFIITELGL